VSKARTTFLEHIIAYKGATEADLIVSRAPVEVLHNAQAQLLRNGLAVVGYAILEDFIRTRTAEILSRIGNGTT